MLIHSTTVTLNILQPTCRLLHLIRRLPNSLSKPRTFLNPNIIKELKKKKKIHQFELRMKNKNHGQVIGIPVANVRYAAECSLYKQNTKDSVIDWMNKVSKKADSCARGIRDHVTLAPKISETVKGKLSLGARILQAGGIEKVFGRHFSVNKREKLLKACQCYLSTTSGPIAGLLFISTEKISFQSDRPLTFSSPKGDLTRIPYKVSIPLRRIKRVSPSENVNKPSQKYVQIVTVDDFEFWFMGFVSYKKSFKYLQQVIYESEMSSKHH